MAQSVGRDPTGQASEPHGVVEAKPLFTDEIGLPLYSTKQVAISFLADQRRKMSPAERGQICRSNAENLYRATAMSKERVGETFHRARVRSLLCAAGKL
jgi:hypothetical protein